MERILKQKDYEKLMTFIHEAMDQGTHFSGQSYEDGMLAVIDVIEGNNTAEEACGE